MFFDSFRSFRNPFKQRANAHIFIGANFLVAFIVMVLAALIQCKRLVVCFLLSHVWGV